MIRMTTKAAFVVFAAMMFFAVVHPALGVDGDAAMEIKLTSPVFQHMGMIPAKFTCDGADVSPALKWSDPPSGTRSFALIMDDPDAPGRTWVHWVLYDLPAQARELPEGVPIQPKLESGALQGNNSFPKTGYGGPCPPRGPAHRYFFKFYALDAQTGLKPGATKVELEKAMKGHILAQTELVGRYKR
jgi:Raf kinase inhibitor-like YbhB/YbcL family protein